MSQIHLPGITDSLTAPGLAFQPAELSPIKSLADDLMRSLDMAGGLAGQLSARDRAIEAEQERMDAHARQVDAAAARLDLSTWVPGQVDAIQAGKLDGQLDKPTKEIVEGTLGSNFQPGNHGPGYLDEVRQLGSGHLAQAIENRREIIRDQAAKDTLGTLSHSDDPIGPDIVGPQAPAPTTEGVESRIAEGMRLTGRPREYVIANMIFPAMQNFAAAGDVDRATAYANLLPSDYAIQRRAALSIAEGNRDRMKRDAVNAADKTIAAQLARVSLGTSTYQDAERTVDAFRSSGILDPEQSDILKANIAGHKQQATDKLDRTEQQRLHEQQVQNDNTMRRDVGLGRWPGGTPITAAGEVTRRMDLDPKDPRFLDADRGLGMLADITRRTQFDVRLDGVNRSLSGEAPGFVATQDDGQAILQSLGQRGIIAGQTTDTGHFIPRAITNPLAFAEATSRLGVVPADAKDLIAASLASPDAAIATNAMTAYADLELKNPGLAAGISLPKDLALKARYVVSRLRQGGVSPENVPGEVQKLWNTTQRMDPGVEALTRDQIFAQGFTNDPAAIETPQFRDTVETAVRESIRGGMRGVPGNIPAEITNAYRDTFVDEYRFAASMTPDKAKAAEIAKNATLQRLQHDYKISEWGGTSLFALKGEVVADARSLRADAVASLGEKAATRLWRDYTPVFVKNNGSPGWVFYNNAPPHETWNDGNGSPVILNPYRGSGGSITDELRGIEAQRRQAANRPAIEKLIGRAVTPEEMADYEAAQDRLIYGGPR